MVLRFGRAFQTDAGSYTLSGQDVNFLITHSLAAYAGSYTLTGNSIGLLAARYDYPDVGVYTLTGKDVQFVIDLDMSLGYQDSTIELDGRYTASQTLGGISQGG